MNYSHLLRGSLFGSMLAVSLAAQAQNPHPAVSASLGSTASAQSLAYNIIYRSPGPIAALTPPFTAALAGGALYATNDLSGAFGYGSVVMLTPSVTPGSWLRTTIYNFTDGPDGSGPNPGLVLDKDGSLYGTTFGTVFHLVPPVRTGGPWTEQTIYTVPQGGGAALTGSLVMDRAGYLYGTIEGNPNLPNPEGIYRLTPPAQLGGVWTQTRIYNYSTVQPHGGLAVTPNGVVVSTLGGSKVIALKVSADAQTTTAIRCLI